MRRLQSRQRHRDRQHVGPRWAAGWAGRPGSSRLLACSAPIVCAVSQVARVMIAGWVWFGGPDPLILGDGAEPARRRWCGGGRRPCARCTWGCASIAYTVVVVHPPGPGRGVGAGVGVEPVGDGGHAELVHGAPGEDLRHHRGAGRVEDQAGLGAALGGLGRVGVRDAVGRRIRRGRRRCCTRRGCAARSPCQAFSFSWNRYHSAMPCFTRRMRMVVAFIPSTLIGSSVANSGIPASPSCRSSLSALNVSRPER